MGSRETESLRQFLEAVSRGSFLAPFSGRGEFRFLMRRQLIAGIYIARRSLIADAWGATAHSPG